MHFALWLPGPTNQPNSPGAEHEGLQKRAEAATAVLVAQVESDGHLNTYVYTQALTGVGLVLKQTCATTSASACRGLPHAQMYDTSAAVCAVGTV